MEKVIRRAGLKSYESAIRGASKWCLENKKEHCEHSKKYYSKNKEVMKNKSNARYHFNKISKELRAIEI